MLSLTVFSPAPVLLRSVLRKRIELLFSPRRPLIDKAPIEWARHPLKTVFIKTVQDQTIGVWSVRRYWSMALCSRAVVRFFNSSHPRSAIMVPLSMQYIRGGAKDSPLCRSTFPRTSSECADYRPRHRRGATPIYRCEPLHVLPPPRTMQRRVL